MTDPKELAKAVVLEAFQHDPAAFVAAQYLGLDFGKPNVMQETFGDALRPEVVEVESPSQSFTVPSPRGEMSLGIPQPPRRIRVMDRPLIRRSTNRLGEPSKPPPAMTEKRKLFIDWVEKRIPDDDPRIRELILGGMRGE